VSEREQQRKIKHRMAVLRHAEEFGNVSLTCRYFGISRPTFYRWRQRFEGHGPEGLCDLSSAPHHSPRATRADEEFYRLLEGEVLDDATIFNDKLSEWEDYYNFNRPHGSLNGQTPHERLRQKTAVPA
jgi:transposase InsO family protein